MRHCDNDEESSVCILTNGQTPMEDFSNASLPSETIGIMKYAAVAILPDPVSSTHLQAIAETILRPAKDGERNPVTLQRMALSELQITRAGDSRIC